MPRHILRVSAANCKDPDQTAPISVQTYLDLHYLSKPYKYANSRLRVKSTGMVSGIMCKECYKNEGRIILFLN